ncbi:uncharacterized protein [Epargyreus clarus]|uniref:uncharacterized protein n=1 Tax=Epargyreus clarus TaxID=520877 RepID=UPI003C2C7108
MEKNGGMVAVVQGLQDSGLTVTLMDGGNQYTLMPGAAPHPMSPQLRNQPSVNCASRQQQCAMDEYSSSDVARHRENGVQATDGRYASTYKTMHCNLHPTSPTQDVTEFPPQRPEVIHGYFIFKTLSIFFLLFIVSACTPGHGNFVVGGYGSGETFCQTSKTNNFRGGMCWPDKGSVCASRPSVQPDAFANSLRKYPSLSPERSTEIVERLITFTQAKNMSRNQNKCSASPTRNSTYSDSSKQTFRLDRISSKNFENKANCKPDITISKKNRTTDSSPVRDRSRQISHEDKDWNSDVCKHDIRCLRDSMKQVRDGFRNLPTQSNNSVNIEIQAAAQMESKEILTLPRIVPMQKTIATSLSPVSSKVETSIKGQKEVTDSLRLDHTRSCKSIQVKFDAFKATTSSVEIKKHRNKSKAKRSKSEEELDISKKSVRDEILRLLQGLNSNSNCDLKHEKESKSKTKKVCRKCKHIFEECARFNSVRRSVSDYACLQKDSSANLNEQKASAEMKNVIRQCLNIKGGELGEKVAHRDHILQEFVNKLQFLASRTENRNNNKLNIGNIDSNYDPSDNKLSNSKDFNDEYGLKKTFTTRKRWHKERNCCIYANNNADNEGTENEAIYGRIVTKTEEELRNLIDLDILAFTEKYRLNITTESLYDLREELFDLLVMNLKNIANHNRHFIKRNIKKILENRGFTEFQSVYLTNILTEHWEDEFSNNDWGSETPNLRSDTFIIFPNITQDSSKYNNQSENSTPNEPDFSINEISQKDLDANVELYVNCISDEINEWLINLPMPIRDANLREAIVNDLSNDIVDRHKYLELNPSSTITEESELEHLKYQIFKWIYKLANNVDMTAVERADDLMSRIRSIPVPIFSVQNRRISSERPDQQGLEVPRLKVIEPSNLNASSTRRLSTPDYVCCKKVTCKRNLNRTAPSVSTSERNNSFRETENLVTTSTRRKSSPAKLPIDKTELSNEEIVSQPMRRTSQMNGTQTNAPLEQHPISSNTGDLPYDARGHFTGGIRIRDDEDVGTEHRPPQANIPTIQHLQTDIDKINDEYNEFLKQWVQTVPIPVTNDKEENMAKSARKEIYDGIWAIISKLRSEPDTFNNRFLCEDILDDEIEKLLSKLPQSSELQSKKHVLKVKLIEKTSDANELIKSSFNSYKQQLIESVKGNVPKPIANECQNPDILELYEELQILNLVEDFIIWSRYQNEDPVTSEGYRNKLLKRTKEFVEELKANHSKALKNIDTNLYLNDILNALKNVPLPSDDTIQQEADEILLGVEIEKWFSELPVTQSDDYVEQLHRRRLRNNLAKQIRDIEKGTENANGALDNTLKHEVSQFLGKAPLQRGESLNINSMVDELMNRLKNRPKSFGNESKRVAFNDPGYDEFSRNLPLSSTITDFRRPSGSDNVDNQNTLTNKSIQAVPPSELYHNIAKPLLDDLRSSRCCDDYVEDLPDYGTFAEDQASTSHRNNDRWYTLQDSRHEYPEASISRVPQQTSKLAPEPAYNTQDSRHPQGQDRVDQYGVPEFPEEFNAPQRYAERTSSEEYSTQRRPAASFPNQRSPLKRVSVDRSPMQPERNIETSRRMSDQMADQRYPSPHSYSPRRSDDMKLNQRTMRSDHIISPHRTPYPKPQQEPERIVSNHPTFHDIEDHSPHMNRSGLFHRSTDQEGIRQTIEHNKSMEATYGGSIPEHYPEYYQPSLMLPGYIPVRIGTRGMEGRGRRMSESADGRYRGADTDVEMDEEEDIRCRCEKMWKRRRPRYCPFDDYDYPMCLSTPYFYPYFY